MIRKTPKEYRLRILAEEAAELSQAALKLIRAIEGDTPVTESEAVANLIEEAADVLNGLIVTLTRKQWNSVIRVMKRKLSRWEKRLWFHSSTK